VTTLRDRFVVNFGALVSLNGVTSRPMTVEQLGYAHGLGTNILSLSLPDFRIEILPATLEATCGVPAEGHVPTEWIRVHGENTAGPGDLTMNGSTPQCSAIISQVSGPPTVIQGTAGACCSDPSGPMCRRTGAPHPQICMACRHAIRADEPFCSVRQGLPCIAAPSEGDMSMASALTGATVTAAGVRALHHLPTPSQGPAPSPLHQDAPKRARDGDPSREDETKDE